jgi:NADH:ubiquinone oxidoreductase subunit H
VAWMTGSVRLLDVATAQVSIDGLLPHWNVVRQPLGFAATCGALMAWCQLPPFAAGDADSELSPCGAETLDGALLGVARAAMHLRQLAAAALLTVTYLGGAHLPWGARLAGGGSVQPVLDGGLFALKTLLLLTLFTWIGAALPVLRWDRARDLLWYGFVPLAVANLAWVVVLRVWGGVDG